MKKIKVGLLVDTFDVPNWAHKMIEIICHSDYAEISLIVKKQASAVHGKHWGLKAIENRNIFFYWAYRKFENKVFRLKPDAFVLKNIESLITDVSVIEVDCIEKKYTDFIQPKDIDEIRSHSIDVFIRLGFRILKGPVLESSRYGIWSYHHGDNDINRGGPAGVWEVMQRWRETGSILQILNEDLDNGTVLYKSWSTVYNSINQNLNNYYWKSALFIPRKLKELHDVGGEVFLQNVRAANTELKFYSNRFYTEVRNSEFLGLLFTHYWQWIRFKWWSLFHFEQWVLLYSLSRKGTMNKSLFRYKKILPPKDRFWADPCVVHNGKYYVFFEELIYKENNGRGHISVFEMEADGHISEPVTVIKKPYHLSYPFVFEYENEFYLIPETSENNTIELYKALEFPYTWEFKMNLMENIKAFDTTVLIEYGKVWLFCSMKEIDGASTCDELFLFYSDELLSTNWKGHKQNPIVSDVKSARPAGRLFFDNGRLYRPSQDCSFRYGYAVNFNEIVEMNESVYKEIPAGKILPNWDKKIVGTHSFSSEGGLTVIDALYKRIKS